MPRNETIEAILEAWYELEYGPHSERAGAQQELDSLLAAAIGNEPITPDEVLDYLHVRFLEFKKSKWQNEKLRVVRSVPPK